MCADASTTMKGSLTAHHISPSRDISHIHEIPSEVDAWLKSVGEDAETFARNIFATNLIAHHFRPHPKGQYIGGVHFPMDPSHPEFEKPHMLVESRDLGSGLVTNAGVNMLSMDWSWIGASTPFCTLSAMTYHGIGTGTTAAAATDYSLQTGVGAGSLTGSTNGYFASSQSTVAPNVYQSVATVSINATLAITEWGLFSSNGANFSRTATGTPTSTTFPDSGASFTTSGNGLKGWNIEISSSAVNTPTTTVMGLITSNTSTSLTLANGWFTLANAAGSTPSANRLT